LKEPSYTDSLRLRRGDAKPIRGDYQFRALNEGFVIQRFWHALKQKNIERYALPTKEMKVLDIGCGSGVVSAFLSEVAGQVIGVDCSTEALKFAREQFPKSNLQFVQSFADEIDFSERDFDRVYILELIEHLEWQQVEAVLIKAREHLKPGGQIFVTTPNFRSAWPLVEYLLDLTGFVPHLADDQHVIRPTKARLTEIATRVGLEVVQMRGMAGAAPFCSIFGWKFATLVDSVEDKLGNPFGCLILAVLARTM
jgi:2-polyprenyl-3-methyl-5-hydroxy-6-metoxy-1,4-benzoquinol methylase